MRRACKGDAIALYGPAGAQAASGYEVVVDDRKPETFSASTFDLEILRTRQLMYFGSNLGPGEHEITVKVTQLMSPQQFLSIDYAEVFTTPSIGGDFLSIPGNFTTTTYAQFPPPQSDL